MRKLITFALLVLGFASAATAQTTVTGTIKDLQGNPYANGTASAFLAVTSGQTQPPPVYTTTTAGGFFTMTLNAGSYAFTVCAPPVERPPIAPTNNPSPTQICFSSAPIAISGGSQDVSTALNLIATSLGVQGTSAGGVTNPSSINNIIFVDGVTYPTIQSGLNAVTTPGKKVFIPSGTYTLSSNLTFPPIPLDFECADRNSTILNFTTTSGNAMAIWSGSRVSNCDIRGPGSGSGTGITIGLNVWAMTTPFTSATLNVSPTYANENGHIYKETVASCTTGGSEPTWPTSIAGTVSDGTCTWQENGPSGAEIYNNIIEGFGNVMINTGAYAYGWRVHDNLLRNGVVVSPPTEALLIGGSAQMNAFYANRLENFQGNGVDINGARNSFYYNTMLNIGASKNGTNSFCMDLVGNTAIAATNVDDNWLEGNVCNTTGGAALFVAAGAGSTVSRNKIIHNTFIGCNETDTFGDCIKLVGASGSGTVDQTEIQGNIIQNAQRYGIIINPTGGTTITNTKILGNTISGSGAVDLIFGGGTSGTLIDGNQLLSGTPYTFVGTNTPLFWGQNNPSGATCTNGELALSANWAATGSASVTAVAGTGMTCSWTITTGTTTGANPTVTDTLTTPMIATTRCTMYLEYGPASTHTAVAGEGFAQTTLSAIAPIFTFNGTPTAAGKTYLVVRTCGP